MCCHTCRSQSQPMVTDRVSGTRCLILSLLHRRSLAHLLTLARFAELGIRLQGSTKARYKPAPCAESTRASCVFGTASSGYTVRPMNPGAGRCALKPSAVGRRSSHTPLMIEHVHQHCISSRVQGSVEQALCYRRLDPCAHPFASTCWTVPPVEQACRSPAPSISWVGKSCNNRRRFERGDSAPCTCRPSDGVGLELEERTAA